MYNYLIIPTNSGFTLQIGSGSVATRYRVKRKVVAIRLLETIGLELRPIDKKYSVLTLDLDLAQFVNSLDDVQELDSETTCTVPIFDLGVA